MHVLAVWPGKDVRMTMWVVGIGLCNDAHDTNDSARLSSLSGQV